MLTRRQQQIWDIIQNLYARNGYAPTLDEIAVASGINTRSTVHQHVQALIREGRLQPAAGKRAYRMPESAAARHPQLALGLPLAGRIAAGKPIEAIAGKDEINPSDMFSGNGRYALEVRGDSMINIGVMDGDFVVIQQQDSARNGDIVVALVDREEATLKRIYRLPDGRIELRPENSAMQPMVYPAESVQVQGKMVGLFRSY
ncbi:transcriptional repressor LexA [Candidatus Thiothrix sp. Deng01]|uniref:LexA repressor n=1 Tax=Candidatus Thiothrix phosphatis TaxID=3112415 RepID=A0ABU6D346_9GAMM|nr:transcriptional repressor LexA [Candidatus Thiothrix sp. Deng01]MEB4593435.1 transcriptional repressor LexA [Candidatus Thiothrix sp. Deng01]